MLPSTVGTGFGPGGGMIREFPLSLLAGQSQPIGPLNRVMNSVIVTVQSGMLDLYRGDAVGGIPWRCVPEIAYQWWLPPSDQYTFFAVAAADLQAVVLLLGP